MPQLRLQTLGSLQAGRSGEAEAVFHGGKACLFLAVLAVTPDEWVPRDHLTRLLWPSSSQSHGRQSLRQLLSTIRKIPPTGGSAAGSSSARWKKSDGPTPPKPISDPSEDGPSPMGAQSFEL